MMDSDVWERTQRFVEEGEREQATKESILARYERVNIHGKVLVDGHHLFLAMLRDIETFNRHVEEHPRFLRGIRNIWFDPDPIYVAEAASHVIELLQEILPLEVAQQFAGPEKMCIASSAAVKGLQEDISRYCAVESQSDILIFDARMPPAANVVRTLEERRGVWSRDGVADVETERGLKRARAGRWEFWGDDGPLKELPYGFKNEFLDVLKHPWHGWKEHLGKRKIWIDKRRRLRQKEKEVDARLVIAGCQAAADPKLDWTCLVTNDADYVPLIEQLHSQGKAVYLLSLGERESRDLKRVVGSQHLINKSEIYNRFPKEPIPEPYWSKPALSFLLPFCLLVELGARLGGEAEPLWDPVRYMECLRSYDDILLE
jgi:uncharacterized LabA/DUF88 family protein